MNIEELNALCHANAHANWQENQEEKVALLQQLSKKAQDICLQWVLILDPLMLTEDFIRWLNARVDTAEKWIPEAETRRLFNTSQQVSNLFTLIELLHQQEIDINATQNNPQLVETYNQVIEECKTKPLLSMIDLRTPNDHAINYCYANYLSRIKSLLANPEALHDLKEEELPTPISPAKFIPINAFNQKLDHFKNKYLVERAGQITTKTFVNKNKLRLYHTLLNAYEECCQTGYLDVICAVIKQNDKAIGLQDFLKDDFAQFCHTWRQENKSYDIVPPPNPGRVKAEQQPSGYMLIERDINVGLASLVADYERTKDENPEIPTLTFLPLSPFEQLPEFLPNFIESRGSQGYVGIHNVNGGHYVCSFIYKWPSGRSTVILIDPAFSSDNKKYALEGMADAFETMLPDCDVVTLDITQQFNGADCGICVLQTAKDIVDSFISERAESFLALETDKLRVNPLALTLNAEAYRDRGEKMVPVCTRVRSEWETLFKQQPQWSAVQLDGDKEGKGYSLLPSGKYDFEKQIWEDKFNSIAKKILKEFKNSSQYKHLVREAKTTDIRLANLQQLFSSKFEEFKVQKRVQLDAYEQIMREQCPTEGEQFSTELEQFLLREISTHVFKPIVFERMATTFISSGGGTLFPDNTFLDDDQRLTFPLQQASELYQHLDADWVELIHHEIYKEEEFQPYLQSKVTQQAEKIRLLEGNLPRFRGQRLTYAMLKQCVDIWQANHFQKKPPKFIKKLNKLFEHRSTDLEPGEIVTDAAIASLKIAIRQWRRTGQGLGSFEGRIVAALESTLNLTLPVENRVRAEALEITFEQAEEELQNQKMAIANYNRSNALYIIQALKHVKECNQKPDAENEIHQRYLDYTIYGANYALYQIPNKPIYFHLENHATWDAAKRQLNHLADSFLGAYQKAKQYDKLHTYLGKLGTGLCIEGRTMDALDWVARLGSNLEKFDELMERADTEASEYLQSTGKSLSLENKIKFISRHYQGTFCLCPQEVVNGVGRRTEERRTEISLRMIKTYLVEVLSEEKARIKSRRKGDLIDIYNNHDMPTFITVLEKTKLDTPGLNRLTSEGETLLTTACIEGKEDHVRILLQKKDLDIHLPNKKGETPFVVACQSKLVPTGTIILGQLLEKLPVDEREIQAKNLLRLAFEQATGRSFTKLLSYINNKEDLNLPRPELEGLSFLAAACLHKKEDILTALIEKNHIDHNSALQNIQVMRHLPGSHIPRTTTMSLVRFAVGEGDIPLTRALVGAGDETEQNKVIQHVLPYFVSSGANYRTFGDVLECVSEPELNKIYCGETLLTHACLTKNLDSIECLLNKQADLFTPNLQGKTPLMIACEQGSEDILFRLLDNVKDDRMAMEASKGILQQSFDLDKKAIFFGLCQLITDRNFLDHFYDRNLDALQKKVDFFTDSHLPQWEASGLFTYLAEPLKVDKIIQLLRVAISNKQFNLCQRVVTLLQTNAGEDELQPHLPELLKHAYTNKATSVFIQLLNSVTHCNIPGLNFPEREGEDTLLTAACQEGLTEIASGLIAKPGLNLEVKGYNRTPLEWAVISGNVSLAKTILDALARQSVETMHRAIAENDLLYKAYASNHVEIFKELLARINHLNLPGLDTGDERLVGGTFFKDNYEKGQSDERHYRPEITTVLLEKGVLLPDNIYSFPRKLHSIYDDLIAALPNSASKPKKDIRHLYLEPIMRTVDGYRKLQLIRKAIDEVHDTKLVELFQQLQHQVRELGAPIETRTYGHSPLHAAFARREYPMPDIANPQERILAAQKDTLYGRTALHYLSNQPAHPDSYLQDQIILGYEEFKPCLDVQDIDGRTPLHYACMNGNGTFVNALYFNYRLEFKAPIDRVNHQTPLHCACMSNSADIITLMIHAPLVIEQINVRDRAGKTALHYACSNNNGAIIQSLIVEQGGASCNIPCNVNKDTPLHIICRSGNLESVKVLMKAHDFYDALFSKNLAGLSPLQELSNRSSLEAHSIYQYLRAFYTLADHGRKLAQRPDNDSRNKAQAIDQLLRNLAVATPEEQRNILAALNLNDAQNPLFKPRTPYGAFFKASAACKTETAKDIVELRQVLAVH